MVSLMFKKINYVILLLAVTMLASTGLVTESATAQQTAKKGITYGALNRQKYDLYFPPNITDETPVLFFLYGGSWESGNRRTYAFIGKSFAEKGYIVAIPDYRIYPRVKFPAFVEDAALAFSKVRARFPLRKIFVAGHSAGAHIGALLTLDKKYLARHTLLPCSDIAGFIGLAGPYEVPVINPRVGQIFPEETRSQSYPGNYTRAKSPPVLLLHGAGDAIVRTKTSTELAKKLRANGNKASAKIYNGVGHMNIVTSLAPMLSRFSPTKKDMLDFMRRQQSLVFACN